MSRRMDKYLRLLVIEDNFDHFHLFERAVNKSAFKWVSEIVHASTLGQAERILASDGSGEIDAVIADLSLPDSDHTKTLRDGLALLNDYPTIVLTSLENETFGYEAIQGGAQDFLSKDYLEPALLRRTVRYAIERFTMESRLKAKNEQLKIFAHTLAHEIKNPLASVTMALGMMNERKDGLPKEVNSMIDLGSEATTRIDSIIRSLLTYADDSESVETRPVDANTLLRGLINDVRRTASVPLTVDVQPEIPILCAVETTMRQVLENLFTNAVRYRHPERDLAMKITWEIENRPARTPFCCLRVSDNGRGVRRDDLEKIFSPFYRGESVQGIDGSGLGLNFCRMAVGRVGGSIIAQSDGEFGTEFQVRLPIWTEELIHSA